jgi:hypothetical protein
VGHFGGEEGLDPQLVEEPGVEGVQGMHRKRPGDPHHKIALIIRRSKGSDPHKAAVVGDTVGDPFKDTSGPSINILIKLLSMVSIVFAGLVIQFHLFN